MTLAAIAFGVVIAAAVWRVCYWCMALCVVDAIIHWGEDETE